MTRVFVKKLDSRVYSLPTVELARLLGVPEGYRLIDVLRKPGANEYTIRYEKEMEETVEL